MRGRKNKNQASSLVLDKSGSPKGNRTPVSAVRGRHPRPLDDGAIKWQPDKDSNPGELIQSQSCYHYTIRLQTQNENPVRELL